MLLWIGNALKTQTLRFETVYTKECSYSNLFISLWWYLNFYTVQLSDNYRKTILQDHWYYQQFNKSATIPLAAPSSLHLVPVYSFMYITILYALRQDWGANCCFLCLPQNISPILYPGSVDLWRTAQIQGHKSNTWRNRCEGQVYEKLLEVENENLNILLQKTCTKVARFTWFF